MCAFLHGLMRAGMRVFVRECVCLPVRACMFVPVRACMFMRVRACVRLQASFLQSVKELAQQAGLSLARKDAAAPVRCCNGPPV